MKNKLIIRWKREALDGYMYFLKMFGTGEWSWQTVYGQLQFHRRFFSGKLDGYSDLHAVTLSEWCDCVDWLDKLYDAYHPERFVKK